ncbi:OmpH family outer membrane protein [Stagnihabitans tardus]|uniref:OmpH family outer membrane protein n=1 Tax=Stagnihabitans tardus TaxID=2699202 RepID=A0AAE5BV35_9RHOB|nr:OmpH family outer membrane protein [Stagnihabitans tardus]NBZ87892.1 OmpH family outer membrane protein [Stagnihabitans tardus]
MPRLLLAALLAAGLGCGIAAGIGAGASAQTTVTPAPQIATLDQDRLYSESRFGRALEAKAQAASQALASENRRIEAELTAEETDLTARRQSLTAQAFEPLAAAFDAKVEKLRADQAAKIEALKAERDADRQAFFAAAVPILADLMRELGAYAILNKQAVILSFDTIDMTDRAIEALDARLGDGTGPRDEPPAAP